MKNSLNQNEIIKMEHVNTIYEGERTPTLIDINLSIHEGEFVCIIGPNGAGKTTLLETINGLIQYTAGTILIMGYSLKSNGNLLRKNIGYVPQEFTVDPVSPFLVKDLVLMGRYGKIGLLKKITKNDNEKVKENLKKLGIEELADRPVGKLSGGQLQKVMLARVLAKESKILLLDEPFSNLDYQASAEFSELISDEHQKKDWTTLMVIHDLNSLPEICNRILYLKDGKIVQDNKPDKILTQKFFEHSFR